jgi:hypothetical protein
VLISGRYPEVHRCGAQYSREFGDQFTALLLAAGAGAAEPDPESAVRAAFNAVLSALVMRTAYGPTFATPADTDDDFLQTRTAMVSRYLLHPGYCGSAGPGGAGYRRRSGPRPRPEGKARQLHYPDPVAEPTARDLAGRESDCCSFFAFTFAARDAVHLDVRCLTRTSTCWMRSLTGPLRARGRDVRRR